MEPSYTRPLSPHNRRATNTTVARTPAWQYEMMAGLLLDGFADVPRPRRCSNKRGGRKRLLSSKSETQSMFLAPGMCPGRLFILRSPANSAGLRASIKEGLLGNKLNNWNTIAYSPRVEWRKLKSNTHMEWWLVPRPW